MQFFFNTLKVLSILFLIIRNRLVCDIIQLRYTTNEQKKDVILDNIGKKIVLLLPKLGPAFIKVGQFLATRPDFIGESMCKNLEKLQDKLPPCNFDYIKPIIARSLKIDKFQYIEPIAVAAASIAQVHKAQTHDGDFVAIKVLRPGIEAKFKENISLMKFLAKIIDKFFDVKRLRLEETVLRIERMSRLEIDLRMEAASADKLRKNLANDKDVYVPKIFWEHVTQNVLVLEWIDGIPLYDRQKLIENGFDLHSITRKFAITFFNQAYRDGFFHADLHQGNVLINSKEQIVFLDFGIMGHLDYQNRLFVAEILKSFLERNYDRVSQLYLEAGFISKSESIQIFSLACRSIGEAILNKPTNEVSISSLLKQLFDTAKNFNMEIQPELLLMQKAMVIVEGISISFDNNSNIWLLIEPWIKLSLIHI